MKPNSISIIPTLGYNPEQITSAKALQWLKFESYRLKIVIQHAKKGGEKKVGKYFLDGYCEATNTAYEFHGCFWHGCTKCYKSDTWNPIKRELMYTTNKRHQERINYLKKELKCKFIEKWECEFEQEKRDSHQLNYFLKHKCNVSDPINPRDALFGGRTNALKLYHKCEPDEQIKYYDFTSLYPYVQKYCRYPVGHPILITENFGNVLDYFGLIKCKILPGVGCSRRHCQQDKETQ